MHGMVKTGHLTTVPVEMVNTKSTDLIRSNTKTKLHIINNEHLPNMKEHLHYHQRGTDALS